MVLPSSLLWASNFGINVHVPPPEVLDRVAQDGIGWIRIDVLWSAIQPAPNEWDWSVYDALVQQARQRGLRILAILQDTPDWATSGPPGTGVPDPEAWRRFCYRAARRYHGQVAAWELWNEPNLDRFWNGTRQDYIDAILLPGARAVHEGDPSTLAVGPALAHLQSGRWDRWLQDCLIAGRDLLDVASLHLYPGDCSHTTVTKALDRGGSYPWDPPSVKKVLQDAGWFGRPFWLTETGMNSESCGQHDQAGFYTNFLGDWFRPDRDLSWLDRVFFYEIMDAPADPGWGIVGPLPELEPKDAYFAYGDFIAASLVDDGEILALRSRLTLRPEGSGLLYIIVRNTGTTAWSAADGYRLTATRDPFALVAGPVELPAGSTVPPGEPRTFAVPVTAPLVPAGSEVAAPLSFRMERTGRWRFGDEARLVVRITSRDDPWPRIDGPAPPPPAPAGAGVHLQLVTPNPERLSYRWQRDGVDLENDGRFSGIRGPGLMIRRMSRDLEGWYRCIVSSGEIFSLSSATVWVGLANGKPPLPRPVQGRRIPEGSVQPAATLRTWRTGLPAELPPPP